MELARELNPLILKDNLSYNFQGNLAKANDFTLETSVLQKGFSIPFTKKESVTFWHASKTSPGIIKIYWKMFPPLFSGRVEVCEGFYFILKCLVEFTSEVILAWAFLYENILNY